jgi:hypothetical protein
VPARVAEFIAYDEPTISRACRSKGIRRIFYEREYKLHTLRELLEYTDVTLERIVP